MPIPVSTGLFQSFKDGKVNAFGKVYTYESGTDTPIVTYMNKAGTVANPNPVVLNENGQAYIFATGPIKIVVTGKCGDVIETLDPVGWFVESDFPDADLPDLTV